MAYSIQLRYLWHFLTHVLAIYLFTSGFFITRFELKHVNVCSKLPTEAHVNDNNNNGNNNNNKCWVQPRFKKAVIIIIDALRDDFARFDESFQASISAGKDSSTTKKKKNHNNNNNIQTQKLSAVSKYKRYYTNHLPVIRETLIKKRKQSRLYRFDADPPTVTMQRLKGLTTGGLPTFIDFKDNFGSSSNIEEDNLILQMKKLNKKIVFMGDDTWEDLFNSSKYFTRSYPYPSFNVKDLDTVDNGVIKHLIPEMKNENGEWDVIIAHFLGVDHCGHRYGPSHPEMSRKLDEMNDVLKDIIEATDEDTLLAVFGDHGMTAHGDHGGSTELEVASSLFLYSGGPELGGHKDNINVKPFSYLNVSKTIIDDTKKLFDIKRVSQIDLVPTLSLLIGLPIPYGNLGRVIPELFLHDPSSNEKYSKGLLKKYKNDNKLAMMCADLTNFNQLLTATRLNAHQTHQYILSYNKMSNALDLHDLNTLDTFFGKAEDLFLKNKAMLAKLLSECEKGSSYYNTIEINVAENTITMLLSTLKAFDLYLKENVDLFRRMWTQFDIYSMCAGIFSAFLLFFVDICWAIQFFNRKNNNDNVVDGINFNVKNITFFTFVTIFTYLIFQTLSDRPLLGFYKVSVMFSLITGINIVVLIDFYYNWFDKRNGEESKNTSSSDQTIWEQLQEWILSNEFFNCIIAIGYCISFTSNSYMEAHNHILPFFIVLTTCTYCCQFIKNQYYAFSRSNNKNNSKNTNREIESLSSLLKNSQHIFLPLGLMVATRILKAYPCRGQENILTGLDLFRTFSPLVIAPIIAYYRMMYMKDSTTPSSSSSNNKDQDSSFSLHKTFIVIETLGGSIWTIIYWAMVERGVTDKFYTLRILLPRAIAVFGVITALTTKIWGNDDREDLFGNAWLWTIPLIPLIMLLLGPHSPLVMLLFYLQHYFVFKMIQKEVIQGRKYKKTMTFMELFSCGILIWFLMEYAFYASGHVSNFNGLHISAAYVGMDNFHFILSGVLLFSNTFIATALSTALVWTGINGTMMLKKNRNVLILLIGACYSFLLFVKMAFVLFARRHLMVWAIFAPKYIFTATIVIVIDVAFLLCMMCLSSGGERDEGKKKM